MQIISQLLSYAFRPFFLLGALGAIMVMTLWSLALLGYGPVTTLPMPIFWHAHEMLFGFVMAVVAGFVLTAVAVWTGRTRLYGAPLGWLIVTWFAGRVVMIASAALPGLFVAIVDMLFPALLVFFFAREVIGGGSRRNYIVVGMVAAIGILNAVYHVGATGWLADLDRTALLLMIHVVLLLISAIAGRIVPSFTANWLRGQGLLQAEHEAPRSTNGVEVATLFMTLLTGCLATFVPASAATGFAALLTAALHALRLSRWRGLATRSEPLLFILHVAYFWLPVGYLLMAWSVLGTSYPPVVALHALTMGAIGMTILAMITRVSLGHTGRPLHAARLVVVAYVLMTLTVIVRLVGPYLGRYYMQSIETATLGWMFAFGLFIWVYWPILTRPGSDED